jgi:hypothetical protein
MSQAGNCDETIRRNRPALPRPTIWTDICVGSSRLATPNPLSEDMTDRNTPDGAPQCIAYAWCFIL